MRFKKQLDAISFISVIPKTVPPDTLGAISFHFAKVFEPLHRNAPTNRPSHY